MDAGDADQKRHREEAHRLYWTSSMSVNSIADELGVSKGTLYDWVEPLPAGVPCPECEAELAYPNRTARDRGFVECASCDLEEELEVVREGWSEDRARRVGPATPGETGEGTRVLWGVAFLGVAAGIAIASLSRDR